MDFEIFKIAGRIAAYLLGESDDVRSEQIQEWMKDNRNERLFGRIRKNCNEELIRERYQNFPVEEGWSDMKKKTAVSCRRRMYYRLSACVAVLAVLFGTVLLLDSLSGGVPDTHHKESVDMMARNLNPFLVLDNGEEIMLDNGFGIIPDSTVPVSWKQKRLTYNPVEEGLENLKPCFHEIIVPVGTEYELKLSDGTVIFLNADSRLRYPNFFSGSVREVELKGEAYFKVVKNPEIPFVVKNRSGKVYVYGTEFNVSAYPEEDVTSVTLVNGNLAVEREGIQRHIRSGEQWSFNRRKDKVIVRKVDTGLYTAWKDGRLKFKDVCLDEIMREVSRWYGVEVHYQSERVRKLKFGCNFNRHQVIDPLLRIFEANGKIKIERNGNKLFIKEGR